MDNMYGVYLEQLSTNCSHETHITHSASHTLGNSLILSNKGRTKLSEPSETLTITASANVSSRRKLLLNVNSAELFLECDDVSTSFNFKFLSMKS